MSRSSCYEQKFAKATTLLLESNTPSVLEEKGSRRTFPRPRLIFSRDLEENGNHFEEREPMGEVEKRGTTTKLMSNMVTEHRPYPMLVFFNVRAKRVGY